LGGPKPALIRRRALSAWSRTLVSTTPRWCSNVPRAKAAREYFHAYDRTGGRSGRPSIKSFFPEKIQSLENLEEPFEPRYPIELTKDGAV
jgi:hypothetical protein